MGPANLYTYIYFYDEKEYSSIVLGYVMFIYIIYNYIYNYIYTYNYIHSDFSIQTCDSWMDTYWVGVDRFLWDAIGNFPVVRSCVFHLFLSTVSFFL